jgi:integration host factor subunit alpha
MTKADIVEILFQKFDFTKNECSDIVEQFFDLMKDCLESGEKIKISSFGNFTVRQKKARKGRNPKTGEVLEIAARRVLTFKPSPVLRKKLNEKTDGQE